MYQNVCELLDDEDGLFHADELYNRFIPRLAPYIPEDRQDDVSTDAGAGYPICAISRALWRVVEPIPRSLADELRQAYKDQEPEEGMWEPIPEVLDYLEEKFGFIEDE